MSLPSNLGFPFLSFLLFISNEKDQPMLMASHLHMASHLQNWAICLSLVPCHPPGFRSSNPFNSPTTPEVGVEDHGSEKLCIFYVFPNRDSLSCHITLWVLLGTATESAILTFVSSLLPVASAGLGCFDFCLCKGTMCHSHCSCVSAP